MGAARRMCAVVGAALTLVWAGGAAARTVELATLTWPPFYGPDLPEGGPVTELVRAALNSQGHRLEVRWVPWPPDRCAREPACGYCARYAVPGRCPGSRRV